MSRVPERIRCGWCGTDPLYVRYHDEEWGVPVHSDRKMFEFLVLESAQAGLSWITVLRKRKEYKKVFANFDFTKVATFTKRDVERLLKNPGIIRNRLKIETAISNAKHFLEIRNEFGTFCNYLWGFVDGTPLRTSRKTLRDIPAVTPLAETIAKDLKKRGFRFLGPTIVYAHLQATGIVNDHIESCWVQNQGKRGA
jgi:DNA-3-methyladenine glycosylase I